MSAVAIPFEDLQEYDGESGYTYPNEDISIWRNFVKGLRIDKAAAICGGGEVGLFTILPTVRKELVLVDHSYCSLKYALQKYILFREHGYKKTVELLSKQDKVLLAELKKVNKLLPEPLLSGKDKYHNHRLSAKYIPGYQDRITGRWVKGSWEYPNGDIPERLTQPTFHGMREVSQIYNCVGRLDARRALAKLHKVKFVHGDFQKLVDRGPFDLFYISNAHQYGNGNTKAINLDLIAQSVRKDGWILTAGDVDHTSPSTIKRAGGPGYPNNWELQEEKRSNLGLAWTYRLYRIRKDK